MLDVRYAESEVAFIIQSYRRLVPVLDDSLKRYWDRAHERKWSCLVSDFQNLDIDKLKAFDQALEQSPQSWASAAEQGEWLRTMSNRHGAGFSLGISPWTDDLILRTLQENTRDVVLIVGHDWYPIVNAAYTPRSPLQRFSLLDEATYARAVPVMRAVEAGIGLLFVNLYPDFRAPGDETTGKMSVDYKPYVEGLLALCSAVNANFRIRGMVSWGGPVWETLQGRLDQDLRTGLWRSVQRYKEQKTPMPLPMLGGTLPYFPFLHPSSYLKPRFADPNHLEAYKAAWNYLLVP